MTAKKLLEDFNTVSSIVSSSFTPVTLGDILSPDSAFWQSSTALSHRSNVPWSVQKDIMNAYLLSKRTDEKLRLLSDEMNNVLLYYMHRKTCIIHCLAGLQSEDTPYSRGAVLLLQRLLWETELHHSKAVSTFSVCDASTSDAVLSDSESDSDSDLDTDSDIDEVDI